MALPDDLLTRGEAAQYLSGRGFPISKRSLEKMASNNNAGQGPPYFRMRWNAVRYKRRDLDAWCEREIERIA